MAHPLYAEFGRSPYSKITGLEVTRYEEGYSHTIMKITDTVLGFPSGSISESVHGGAIATMVDVGMGGALLTRLKDDELMRTVQLQVNYLAAAISGILVCEAKVVSKGRKIATVEAEVNNEEGLIAKATGTYYISKAKS